MKTDNASYENFIRNRVAQYGSRTVWRASMGGASTQQGRRVVNINIFRSTTIIIVKTFILSIHTHYVA